MALRGLVQILGGSLVAVLVMGQVADALSPGSVSSVVGTAVRMRGNTVKMLSRGDSVNEGDRIITSSGARVTFANGTSIGPNSSVVCGKNSGGSNSSSGKDDDSDGKSHSGLFDDDKDHGDRDKKKGHGGNYDDDDDDHEHGDHDDDDDDDDDDNPKHPHSVSD